MKKKRSPNRHRLRDLAEDIEDVARLHPCSNMVRSAVESCVSHICAVASAYEANAAALKIEDKIRKIEHSLKNKVVYK